MAIAQTSALGYTGRADQALTESERYERDTWRSGSMETLGPAVTDYQRYGEYAGIGKQYRSGVAQWDPTGASGSGGGSDWYEQNLAQTNRDIAARNLASRNTAAARTAARTASGPSLSKEARSAWQSAIDQYKPGGGYGKGVEAALERGRVKSVASGTQALVSSGLYNTTMLAGLGKKYEEEVAAPTRAGVESTRAQAISGLQAGLATAEQGGSMANLQAATSMYSTQTGANVGTYNINTQASTAAAGMTSQKLMQDRQFAMDKYLTGQTLQSQERRTTTQYGGASSSYGQGYYI